MEEGTFTVGGKITFGAAAGCLNFTPNSIASFVSEHTQPEIEAFITATNICIDNAYAPVSSFNIVEDAGEGTTTVTLGDPSVGTIIMIM